MAVDSGFRTQVQQQLHVFLLLTPTISRFSRLPLIPKSPSTPHKLRCQSDSMAASPSSSAHTELQVQVGLLSNIGTPSGQSSTLPAGALDTNPNSPYVDQMLRCMTDVALRHKATDCRQSLRDWYVHCATDRRGTWYGYIAWRLEKGEGREPTDYIRIRRLHVVPEAGIRRRGIGKRLLLEVFTFSHQRKLNIKVLAMTQTEPPAYTYFERFGFIRQAYNPSSLRTDVIELWLQPTANHMQWYKHPSGKLFPQRRIRGRGPTSEQLNDGSRRLSSAASSSSLSSSRVSTEESPHPEASTTPQRRKKRRTKSHKKDEKCVIQ